MSLKILLLSLQGTASLISLIGALVVVGVVVFLISTASVQEDKYEAKHRVYHVRGRYFAGLSILIIISLLISLRLLPYPRFQNTPDETVTVVGMQWFWKMAKGESKADAISFQGINEITLPANKTIRFLVTSADVNHNFAIYNSKGELVAQTQAMPQYTNELHFMFEQKGDYEVLCLEYCGMAHAIMVGKIHVE